MPSSEDDLPVDLVPTWERFLKDDYRRPAGLPFYEDIYRNPVLFPLQRSRELRAMMERAATLNPQVVMEIGTDKGGSFYHWIKCNPGVRKAIGIEIRGVPYWNLFEAAFPRVQICMIGGSSRDPRVMHHVAGFLEDDLIDCLFLDGEKPAVGMDFTTWRPKVRPGGLVFIHDIVDPIEPQRVFRQLARTHAAEEIIDVSEVAQLARFMKEAPAYAGWLGFWKETSCGVGVITC